MHFNRCDDVYIRHWNLEMSVDCYQCLESHDKHINSRQQRFCSMCKSKYINNYICYTRNNNGIKGAGKLPMLMETNSTTKENKTAATINIKQISKKCKNAFNIFKCTFQIKIKNLRIKLLLFTLFCLLLTMTRTKLHKPNTLAAIAVIQLPNILYRPTEGTSVVSTLITDRTMQQRLLQQQIVPSANTTVNYEKNKSIQHKTIEDTIALQDTYRDINSYVSDEGQQYKEVKSNEDKYLNENKANEEINTIANCPKVCYCLDSVFDCSNKNLTYVPNIPDYVQQLDLKRNLLNDRSVMQLKNKSQIVKLTLKRNQLESMPILLGLNGLKNLNLAFNRIKLITKESLAALPKLKTLDLSRNHLHTLDSNYFPLINCLAHLLLNGNKIMSINEHVLESLNDLVDLELNNNRLTSLPVGVFRKLNKLRKLSLNSNRLEINWSTFKGLSALQKLYLKGNNIRGLQDGVFHVMRAIETIHLDDNNITSLNRQGLFNLTKLQHLSLSNNLITRIEMDTWEFTQSLVSLDLSSNRISDFKSQHLECLQHLEYLNLGYNNIQFLPENTFDCVRNLKELNLHGNNLAWNIEDLNSAPLFKSLHKLKNLNLIGNNLKQISSKALTGLSNLEILQLNDNPLATIQSGAFDHILHLNQLYINSFNIICDCENRDFLHWLLRNQMTYNTPTIKAFCNYPENLRNQSLLSMSSNQLACVDDLKPVIIQESENQLAVKGANITLECIANTPSNVSLEIKWRQDNQVISNSFDRWNTETRFQYYPITNKTTVTSYLHLYNVGYGSAGRFQCVVSNDFGAAYSEKIKLLIGIHPTFVETPSNLTVDMGDTIRLVCSATGDPIPEMSLQKFGGTDFPAATERRLKVVREENAFIIIPAKLVDTGIYTCTAVSAAGEIKINASISVNDKQLPKIPRSRQEIVQNESTVLKCLCEDGIDLIQPSSREWYKDNKPFHISSVSLSDRYYFTTEKELLVVVNTQPSDAGEYRCEITSNSKTITVETELVVVKENFSSIIIIISIIVVTILCLLFGSLIVWFVLYMQQRKSSQNCNVSGGARVAIAPHHTLGSSHCSALEQTQLSNLNNTSLQQSQLSPYKHTLHHNYNRQSKQTRPHSLADFNFHINDQQQYPQHNRVIITQTPHSQTLQGNEGFTLEFSNRNCINDQQDQLSNKDSGTGSDTAVKGSMEDFTITLLPSHAGYDVSIEKKKKENLLENHNHKQCSNNLNHINPKENYLDDQIDLCEISERDFFIKNNTRFNKFYDNNEEIDHQRTSVKNEQVALSEHANEHGIPS